MDTPVQQSVSPNTNQSTPRTVSKNAKWGFTGIGLGILCFLLVLIILNYFNIIQLERTVPFLSFLPRQTQPEQKTYDNPFQKPLSKEAQQRSLITAFTQTVEGGPIRCPSTKSFCDTAVYKNKYISGTVSNNDPIYAAFDGQLIQDKPPMKNVSVFILINEEKKLRALYFLPPDHTSRTRTVKAGDVITTFNGKTSTYLGEYNFKFTLYENTQNVWIQRYIAYNDLQ